MRLIPVLDIKNGHVVRAIGGRRDKYRPLVSNLVPGHSPIEIASALVARFAPAEMYVADLNAIAGGHIDRRALEQIRSCNAEIWLDAGVKDVDSALRLAEEGVAGIICGLESISGPKVLGELVERLSSQRVIFSLDLRAGVLLGNLENWPVEAGRTASAIVKCAAELGIRRIIVLDLADVGEGKGVRTESLCRAFISRHPEIELIAGGGIRGIDDWKRLESCGVHAALAASALHDGRIRPEDLDGLSLSTQRSRF